MFRPLLALCSAIAALCLSASAQTPIGFLPVSAQQFSDVNGNTIDNATVCAQVTINGQPASVQAGGAGGVVTVSSRCAPVSSGSFTLNLPDMALSTPKYACLSITATDNLSGESLLGAGYSCVQPRSVPPPNTSNFWCTSTKCNFDALPPFYPANVVMTAAQGIQGVQGVQGTQGAPGTTTATGVNGSFVVPFTTYTMALRATFPNSYPGITAFCDSNCVGIGTDTGGGVGAANVYNPTNNKAYFSIIASAIGGVATNCGEGGSQNADGVAQMFGKRASTTGCGLYGPKKNANPLVHIHLGTNAWYQCAALSGNTAGCLANESPAHRTLITWNATTNKKYATSCAYGGTPSGDAYLPQYAQVLGGVGNTATCTITLPSGVSGLAVHYEAFAGTSGATASVAIDGASVGSLQAYGYNGQTIQTGYIGTTTTVWTEIYGGLSAGSHTVVIKQIGAGTFSFVGVSAPEDPALRTAGSARVESDGVPQQSGDTNSAFTASLDTNEKANVTLAQSVGFPVVFADFRAIANVPCDLAATNYVDTAPDLTTHTCVASTQPGAHFSDDGHKKNATAVLTAIGGSGAGSSPGPSFGVPGTATSFNTFNSSGLADQTLMNPSWCAFAGPSGRVFCQTLGYTPTGYTTPYGVAYQRSYENMTYAPSGNYMSWGFYTDGLARPVYQSDVTRVMTLSPTEFIVLVPTRLKTLRVGPGSEFDDFEDVRAAGCSITAGAIGNYCEANVNLLTTAPDIFYGAVCTVSDPNGITEVGSIHSRTTTAFRVYMSAMTTTATGGGTIVCHVTHTPQ